MIAAEAPGFVRTGFHRRANAVRKEAELELGALSRLCLAAVDGELLPEDIELR
jgi:hypothetical protein